MTDREPASYEATLTGAANNNNNNNSLSVGQKASATSLPVPSLTSKPLKQQQAMKEQPDSPPSGYYFNVAQKGKLILPTALWILLIVAGISFLSLLASLNRTVDTLDTLVEIEQETHLLQLQNSILDQKHPKLYDAQSLFGDKQATADKRHQPTRHPTKKDNGEFLTDKELTPLASSSSWLSFPSWTSLEPIRAKPAADLKNANVGSVTPMGSVLDELTRKIIGGTTDQMDEPEISGSIVITSSGGGALPMGDSGMIDSILKQFMPMFGEGFKSGPGGDTWRREPAKRKSNSHLGRGEDSVRRGPLIAAKIENLNINLGDNVDDSKNKRPAADEADGVEGSIESMMSKLLDRKSSGGSPLGLEEVQPIIELPEMSDKTKHSHGHHHHHNHKSLKTQQVVMPPLGDLIPVSMGPLPFEAISFPFGAPLPFMMPDERHQPANSKDKNRNNQDKPTLGGLNSLTEGVLHSHQPSEDPQVILSVASNDPHTDLNSFMAGHVPQKVAPQLMPGQPPYELPVGSPISTLLESIKYEPSSKSKTPKKGSEEAQKVKDDTQWDMLSNDLASSILQSLLQPPAQIGPESEIPASLGSQPIVLLNGQPITQDGSLKVLNQQSDVDRKSQSPSPSSGTAATTLSSLSDMLSMIFDSPALGSISKMAVDEAQNATKTNHADEEAEKMFTEMKTKLEQTMSAPSTGAKPEAGQQASTQPINDPLTMSIMPSAMISSDENSDRLSDPTEAIMNELIGNMFTSAQFGGNGGRQEVGTGSGSPSGSSASGGSSGAGSPSSTGPQPSSARESLLCNCTRVPGSPAGGQPPSGSSPRPSVTYSSSGGGSSSSSGGPPGGAQGGASGGSSSSAARPGSNGSGGSSGSSGSSSGSSGSSSGGSGSSGGPPSSGSSGGGSPPSRPGGSTGSSPQPIVLVQTTTPTSAVSELATTTTTIPPTSPAVNSQTEPTPLFMPVPNAENTMKPDQLPNDPLLKGFLGVLEDNEQSFFPKEDVNIVSANLMSNAALSMAPQKAAAQTTATPSIKPQSTPPTTTSAAPKVSPTQQSSTAAPPTTPMVKKATMTEVLDLAEIPSNVPMIDLAPFANPALDGLGLGTSKAKVEASSARVTQGKSTLAAALSTTKSPSFSTTKRISTTSLTIEPNSGANVTSNTTTASPANKSNTTGKPPRTFLDRADDLIGRFKKLF